MVYHIIYAIMWFCDFLVRCIWPIATRINRFFSHLTNGNKSKRRRAADSATTKNKATDKVLAWIDNVAPGRRSDYYEYASLADNSGPPEKVFMKPKRKKTGSRKKTKKAKKRRGSRDSTAPAQS
ncbi:hypothetical protein FIE12Z_11990 [Fusarium flagelliforme]|uniref:Uncharacterized protein n=1 Tax=Fusarium flagelliforme TaxID=2675880 RepID=A0A395M7A7_9HYPO|nr:hypothetical protein FIE12Z_11990 [Fusarium flagelliforme]